jgi:biofilm protein TabA
MIIGSLKDTQRIASFHPLFKTLFDFLANNDLSNIQLGKTELLKNKLYIICSTLEKGASREQLLEGHRKYIDVHILLEGKLPNSKDTRQNQPK